MREPILTPPLQDAGREGLNLLINHVRPYLPKSQPADVCGALQRGYSPQAYDSVGLCLQTGAHNHAGSASAGEWLGDPSQGLVPRQPHLSPGPITLFYFLLAESLGRA